MSGVEPETGKETNTLENKFAYLKFVWIGRDEYEYGNDSEIKSWSDLINAFYGGKIFIINYNDENNAVSQEFKNGVLRVNFVNFNYLGLLNKTPINLYSFEITEEGIKKVAEGEIALEQ